jgi:flagellar biosynthesis protein FlhB
MIDKSFVDELRSAGQGKMRSQYLLRMGARLAIAITPVLLMMFAAGVFVNVSQTGLIFNTGLLAPKFSHISPLAGLKRITSIRGAVRLGFGIIKVLIISAVAYVAVTSRQESIVMMWTSSVPVIAKALFECIFGICMWIAASLLVLGVAEYGFQWWRYEEDLKMSDQELRDEMKETNGNPQVQQRRKQIQRQMMMQRINTEVPKADVVVTNPTELAIAISYDPTTMIAPVVIAKGAGGVAQRIRKLHSRTVFRSLSESHWLSFSTRTLMSAARSESISIKRWRKCFAMYISLKARKCQP